MSAPVVPQRPVRSQNPPSSNASPPLIGDTPEVPPRPSRRADRSISRDRENYARSPLNDSPFASNIPPLNSEGYHLQRPPSVSALPSVGQEGMEYASLSQKPQSNTLSVPQRPASPNHTSNVGDLPLHAPKATVSNLAAKEQVIPVTRTDSVEAAHVGIGKPRTDYEQLDLKRAPSASRAYQYRPPSAVSQERPPSTKADSLYGDEHDHGIPEIGVQVPMNPMAGDVQAPSPALHHLAGIASHSDALTKQSSREHHVRRRSGHLPPGSYGLHGHGIHSQDQLERDWYQKHPDELVKEEHGAYGPGSNAQRSEWVLSSEQLNRLVRETSKTGIDNADLPTEDGAFRVAAETASSSHSPELRAHDPPQRPPSATHLVPESPLRRSFDAHRDDHTTDDEGGIKSPKRASGKVAGIFAPGDMHREMHEYGVPILASDEVAKNPGAESLRAAVTPDPDHYRNHDEYYRSGQRSGSNSRASSRPTSIHGHHGLSKVMTHDHEDVHTPLEEIEEYEPLFKDDDGNTKTAQDRFKLHDHDRRLQRFPSRDIWEDTPSSLQLEATVGSALPTEDTVPIAKTSSLFEHPDKERARKGEVTEEQKQDFLQDYLRKNNKSLSQETRPGMKPRFPSRDIWEDTPDSLRLETIIASSPPQDAAKSPPSIASKPIIPPRPGKTKEFSPTDKKAPSIPDRPKPQVPPRPAKKSPDDQADESSLDQIATSPPATKPKPNIPSSSKFANRAGFLNDLNSRLQSGPPAPKPRETDQVAAEDKQPLADARKGRARGPQRRKPADSSADSSANVMPRPVPFFSIVQPWTVWSIPEETEDVSVTTTSTQSPTAVTTAQDLNEAPESSPLATNTAGERLQSADSAPSTVAGALAHPSNADMDARARAEEQATKDDLREHQTDVIGFEGDLPEPIVEQPDPLGGIISPKMNAPAHLATEDAAEQPVAPIQDVPSEPVLSHKPRASDGNEATN